jgi:hypothetical protein
VCSESPPKHRTLASLYRSTSKRSGSESCRTTGKERREEGHGKDSNSLGKLVIYILKISS